MNGEPEKCNQNSALQVSGNHVEKQEGAQENGQENNGARPDDPNAWRKKKRGITELLRYKTEHMVIVVDGVEKVAEDHVTDQIVKGAAHGDKFFVELLYDRLEGKSRQTLHVTDEEYVVAPAPSPDTIPQDAEIIEVIPPPIPEKSDANQG